MGTYQNVSEQCLAPFAHSESGGQTAADTMLRKRVHRAYFAADALAADTWTRTIVLAELAVNITAVKIIPDATLTAHDTNYATLSFETGAVGSTASRDSFTTKITGGSGNWAVAVAESFTVVTSTDSLTAGQILTVSKAVTAAGVVIPAHHIEVHYDYV